jgi:hypothetical protein
LDSRRDALARASSRRPLVHLRLESPAVFGGHSAGRRLRARCRRICLLRRCACRPPCSSRSRRCRSHKCIIFRLVRLVRAGRARRNVHDAPRRSLCMRLRPLCLRLLRQDHVVEQAYQHRLLRRGGVCDAVSEEDTAQFRYRYLVRIDAVVEVPVLAACVGHVVEDLQV